MIVVTDICVIALVVERRVISLLMQLKKLNYK